MKKVIFSYDYELFFGIDSGTIDGSLIIPTNKILNHLESNGFKGTFFVDWQMIKYLRKENTERTISDYDKIITQIKDIICRGHRIELHIHPHWVDAKYIGDGKWDFSNFHHYSLWSFPESEIVKMFIEGKQLLESIARDVDPHYEICAFRAGGWAVQPFDKLKKAFVESEIKVDSSVAYDAYYKCDFSFYDFRYNKLKDIEIYKFEDDVLNMCETGSFIEIPITTYKRSLFHKIADRLYRVITGRSNPITDGTHSRPDLPTLIEYQSNNALITISKRSPLTVFLGVWNAKTDLVTLIDHPKDYSPSNEESFYLLSKIATSTTYFEQINNII